MDQEVATVFKKKPKVKPVGSASDLNQMQMGKIDSRRNSVMFTRAEGQKCLFALADKHLYTTACLEHVLSIIKRCKENSADDVKYFDDMINWYIRFRQTILSITKCLFALADKHLYTTTCLEHVLSIIKRCKDNSADDIKYFEDMINWYIRFRQTILSITKCLFSTVKKKVPASAAGPSKK